MKHKGLEIISFEDIEALHQWLVEHHALSSGIWIKLYKVKSKKQSVNFLEVLEEGLCFGWSESLRHAYDEEAYLQKFTPRKSKGTTSTRNRLLVDKLIKEKRMTPPGLAALGLGKRELADES